MKLIKKTKEKWDFGIALRNGFRVVVQGGEAEDYGQTRPHNRSGAMIMDEITYNNAEQMVKARYRR